MAQDPPEPLDPRLQLALPAFEGPLDLLLHLIRKHELDILDLPIAFVTERYLGYLSMMEHLDLDVASEYLVMAATLAHIKSKMLLPQEPRDQEDDEPEEEVDPRAELIRRLLEYQKYKGAAEALGARPLAGRDVFGRGSDAPIAVGPAPLASMGIFSLLDAFSAVLKRANAELAFEVSTDGVSIQDRMRQLVEILRERRQVEFEALFEGQARVYDLVVTFMAILEMAKRRLVAVYQADPYSPIHLRSTVVSDDGTGSLDDVGDEVSEHDDDATADDAEAPEDDDAGPEAPEEHAQAPEEDDAGEGAPEEE